MGDYSVIYSDPPWSYDCEIGQGVAAAQYDTCPVERNQQFADLVGGWAADDCALFMWGTWPKLPEHMITGNLWGFRYVTCAFVWVKTTLDAGQGHIFAPMNIEAFTFFGIGYHSASNTEFCTLWKKGNPPAWGDNTIRQLVFDQPREHSRKPDKVRGLIDRAYPEGKRIEMFARTKTQGWDVFGNQCDKFGGQ